MKQAIISLADGSMTSGKVSNIIEITAEAALGFVLPDNTLMWDCGQYPVAIGDDWNDGVFTREDAPLTPVPTVEQQLNALKSLVAGPEPVTLDDYKAAKITDSKTQLADYLVTNPLTYSDGKQYSVTAEKQSLLTSALARYQIATAAGVDTALKWNATGEECTEWAYADLAALALAIAAYVEPLVAQQQAVEVAINACTTIDAVKAITIAYGA